jgi:hypothetical protein
MHDDQEHTANVAAFIHRIEALLSIEQIPAEQKLAILHELLSIAQLYEGENEYTH